MSKMRCAVFGCDNKDSHRMHSFPTEFGAAQKWRESLKLNEFPIELLQARFGVCRLHFSNEDYEAQDGVDSKRLLKAQAVPKLSMDIKNQQIFGTSLAVSENGETELIRIMAPTNANIALLQSPSTSKPYRTRSMEFSTASTGGNTDISILKTHDSHYGDSDDTDNDDDEVDRQRIRRRQMLSRIDAPDFTVVSCPFEDSTEILHLHTIKPSSQNGYSGTDSDIEVLMSEEINETEWSAALENLENNALEYRGKATTTTTTDCSIEAILLQTPDEHTAASNSLQQRQPESTDRDCSVEELSRQSSLNESFDGLSQEQLIDVIHEQRTRIQRLESTLLRYRSAQQELFEHVDAMRQEFKQATESGCN